MKRSFYVCGASLRNIIFSAAVAYTVSAPVATGHLKCHSVALGFGGSEQQSGSCHLSSQRAVGSEGQTERKVPMRCRKLYFTMRLVQKNRGSGLLFLRGF